MMLCGTCVTRTSQRALRLVPSSAVAPLVIGSDGPTPGSRGYGKSTKERHHLREEKEETVYQYAGKNSKPTDRVYAWGYAATGALGVRTFVKPEKHQFARKHQLSPHRLAFMDEHDYKVRDVACGYGFTVFLAQTSSGTVALGSGINTDSQLGYQEYPKRSGRLLDYVIEPAPIELPLHKPTSTKLELVDCGRAHSILVTDSEGVFSLGHNAYGQCGRPTVENEVYRGSQTINKVKLSGKVKQVACGQDHTLFLMEGGDMYGCGLACDGQTGVGHSDCVGTPVPLVGDVVGENIVYVSSRVDCSLAVSDKGDLFGWGNSEYGQLNSVIEDKTMLTTPRHMPFSEVGRVVKAAAAGSMCALINEAGDVYVWGYGILGKGPKLEQSATPQLIPATLFGRSESSPDIKVVDIQCGINHFAALNSLGDLYVWGRNTRTCLGLGHKHDQFFPLKVNLPARIEQVSCGVDHTVALCKSFA